MAKFDNHEMAIIEVKEDGELSSYDLGNHLQDIFGRCLGEQASFERIDQVFDEIWQKDEIVTFDELNERMYAKPRYYVIEYTDETSSYPNFDHVVISEEPERTNMSNEVRIEGWCGTTNGTCVHARGMYDSIEEARAFIDKHYEEGVREVEHFIDEGATVIAKFLIGRYEKLDRGATSEYVWDELDERITAQSTDQEIEAIAADLEETANGDGFTLTGVEQLAKDLRWTKKQLGA